MEVNPVLVNAERLKNLMRSLLFKDSVKNQSSVGTGVQIGWHMTEQWFLLLGYDLHRPFQQPVYVIDIGLVLTGF